jgi:uncharacterized protein YbjT (DUF2867 family)
MIPSTLPAALEGVHTAYYLIHNMSSGRGYTERELEAARNFVKAAEQAGVEHIIYLGGLADPEQHIAPHMRSRIETGKTLRQGKVPVTEFRAGVIIGSGSISFEMIRFMTELFPIVPGSVWFHNRSQPIAVQNVVDYLAAALKNPNGRGRIFEIGGPEIVQYRELILRYARERGHKRNMFLLPYIPIRFMAFGVALMTPVPYPIAYALVGGLSKDSIVKHDEVLHIFPEVKLIGIDEATRKALGYLSPVHVERVWDDGQLGAKSLKQEGFFILHREEQIHAPLEKVFSAAAQIAKKMKWQVEANVPHQRLLIRRTHPFGEHWLEWRVESITAIHPKPGLSSLRDGAFPSKQSPRWWWGLLRFARNDGHQGVFVTGSNLIRLTQTSFFAPRGLGGFLYWYLLYPIHALVFRGRIRAIAKQAESEEPS